MLILQHHRLRGHKLIVAYLACPYLRGCGDESTRSCSRALRQVEESGYHRVGNRISKGNSVIGDEHTVPSGHTAIKEELEEREEMKERAATQTQERPKM